MKEKQEKFKALYDQHHQAFCRYCNAQGYGIIDSKDLMSESLLKAYEGMDRLQDDKAFLRFLISIARNIIKNKLRRKKFMGVFHAKSHDQIPDTGLSPEQRIDVQILYHAINLLPPVQKEALVLFEISGYSIKEICQIQAASESAVKSRLKRGRERLAVIFKTESIQTETILKPSKLLASVFL